MGKPTLDALLRHLIARWEGEVVEFKRAGDGYSTSDIGKYFSALANEANLRDEEKAWLVFGVDNASRSVVGTNYRPEPERLHSLKMQISEGTEPSITLRDIHELQTAQGRVLLLEIPAAPQGMPIAWKGHYYARSGESLTHLGLDKQDALRGQVGAADWTAQVVAGATLADLDTQALTKARESFARKYANRFTAEDVTAWPDAVFLDRARLTQNGHITRATLLLLGKAESAYRLSPHPAQITWKLEGPERAYLHFAPPFLLTTTELYQKIRNVPLRILPDDQLVPVEVAKYDRKIVLEALHNCIAHQDYARSGRVHKTPRRYRNPFLTQAMAELNMIDTMGYGIHEMHVGQARRYFPMPDYDLTEPRAVKMTLYGAVVDVAYSRMLIQKTNLPLEDILALDRVQKSLPIDDLVVSRLRRAKLIEGRKPHLYVSAVVASATAAKANYINTRGQDDAFYAKLVLDYLSQFGAANRLEINTLLFGKLSDALDEVQKHNRISNLLTNMRRAGRIKNTGPRKAPRWVLAEKMQDKNL
ncbi:MAG: putative DNA binding domain-containing protein [Rhodoferax sp.]|nr:putative DNA binding domain-containing protein [Rhodoferax sp.]